MQSPTKADDTQYRENFFAILRGLKRSLLSVDAKQEARVMLMVGRRNLEDYYERGGERAPWSPKKSLLCAHCLAQVENAEAKLFTIEPGRCVLCGLFDPQGQDHYMNVVNAYELERAVLARVGIPKLQAGFRELDVQRWQGAGA